MDSYVINFSFCDKIQPFVWIVKQLSHSQRSSTTICAHEIGSRCIVASDKRVVSVEQVLNARRNAYLSVDGGRAVRLNMGDVATIRKSHLETRLVRLKERSFYDVVSSKFSK